ncbi:MAG: phosphoglucosamine mutase, partial [Candidatus Omnitrophota bacterium]
MENHLEERHDRLFGTDGIRGTPGIYPLTNGMLFKIGCSAAKLLLHRGGEGKNYKVVIGRDSRMSGQRIEMVLVDALNSYGIDAVLTGIVPTPALSYLARKLEV